jgi:hypothetical protein
MLRPCTVAEAGESMNSSKVTEAAIECACDCTRPRQHPRFAEHLPLIPAIVLVVLPKCPLCLAAWFGILGSVSATAWFSAVWGIPLAAGLLSVALAILGVRARRRRDARPLWVGILGAAALLCGKCFAYGPLLLYAGLGLLAGASFWSTGLKSSRTSRVLGNSH